MPVLALLHHKLMYIIRQHFNRINQSHLINLSPSEIIKTVETLIKPPLETQEWYETVCNDMQNLGINK